MCRTARCGWLSASGRVIGQTVPRAPMTNRPSGLQLDRSERGMSECPGCDAVQCDDRERVTIAEVERPQWVLGCRDDRQ